MAYVDGFLLPVKRARLDDYKAMAATAATVWTEYGALAYVEAISDDVSWGERTSFPRAVELEEDEVVIFSWITYPDRAARDAINAKVMEDPRIKGHLADLPLDGKRMIWGGFEAFVERP